MERKAEHTLLNWKNSKNRKPLLIYGARQVGKTWLMKKLGEKEFENTVYVNFEKEISLRNIFEQDYQPNRIIKLLETYFMLTIIPGKTLVIFDEIQEAKGALTSLKYFREEMQELHLIGAGSLLGIALEKETSFPVGQVSFLNLYPMDFNEFLLAKGHKNLCRAIEEQDWDLLTSLRSLIISLLKQYLFVGGMPEAVLSFSKSESYQEVREIQNAILQSYEQDFSKHAPTEVIPRIRMIWNAVVSQLAKENKKFIYGILKEGARAKDFELALNWLENYGLIYRVHRTKKANFPLAAYADLPVFKVYTLDVGLLGALGNLSAKTLIENERLFTEFKGSLSEQFVLQELKAIGVKQLFYWANDSGSAELDFIVESDNKIYPIEVKSGENLQAKSLKTFHDKHPELQCFRSSLSDFRMESWMTNVPLYGVNQLFLIHKDE
ncbi:MAG: ATP-binding protein [Flavobacteriales bacterium]|nr:ATP-binding protein [Flavobacteriales bacterium]